MRKLLFLLSTLLICLFSVTVVNAYEYTCTYKNVEIDPSSFYGTLGIWYSFEEYNYAEPGVVYEDGETEKLNIVLTLTTDTWNFSYVTYPASDNAQYFSDLINNSNYTYDVSDAADIYDYYKTYKKNKYYSFSDTATFNITYQISEADGDCPDIVSSTGNAGYINGVMMINWNFGTSSNSSSSSTVYTAVPSKVDEEDEILNDEEDAFFKTCSEVDLGDGYGSHVYYIMETNGRYYYKFYGGYELFIIDGNISCGSEKDFQYCPWKVSSSYNKESTVIYSEDTCTAYYNGNLDYSDPDYFDYQGAASTGETEEDDLEEFSLCETDALIVFQLVGYAIFIIKILVPLLIIGQAMIELFKVVMSGEDKDLKATTSNLIKRLIAGIIIFFVPTLVSLALSLVERASDATSKFNDCHTCLLEPLSEGCSILVEPIKED